jgi:hypothetical protein
MQALHKLARAAKPEADATPQPPSPMVVKAEGGTRGVTFTHPLRPRGPERAEQRKSRLFAMAKSKSLAVLA